MDTSVTSATTIQAVLSAVTSVTFGMASESALPASVRPMIMATGPVMDAGRMVSTALRPKKRTSRPAAMDTKPERMMPNCAYWMASVGRMPSTLAKPSAAHMLAMAVR